MKTSTLYFALFLTMAQFYCAELGLKPANSVTGKEARKMIQEGLILVTLIDASYANSSDYSSQVAGRYELVFDLLNPYMVKIDEDANYSKKEVQKCVDAMSKFSLNVSSSFASFQCSLKPLSAAGI
jgi:small lipoprotein (TIGR04452 family)